MDFDPGAGTNTISAVGNGLDGYLLKLDEDGDLIWVRILETSDSSINIRDVALDSQDNLVVVGFLTGTVDMDPGAGVIELTNTSLIGFWDTAIGKYDTNGNYLWARQLESEFFVAGIEIAIDQQNSNYITGFFTDQADFDPGAGTFFMTSNGGTNSDAFICKLNSSGNFEWAQQYGGEETDFGGDIITDQSGGVYLCGGFEGMADFDAGSGTFILDGTNGGDDIFLVKVDLSGDFQWAVSAGSSESDGGDVMNVDSNGNIYVAGIFKETVDFDPGSGEALLTSAGGSDTFLWKFSSQGVFQGVGQLSGPEGVFPFAVEFTPQTDELYLAGRYFSTVDFDPSSGVFELTSQGVRDSYVLNFTGDDLGINDDNPVMQLSATPNPTRGNVRVSIDAAQGMTQLVVFDVLGRIVWDSSDLQDVQNIQLPDPAGLYFLKALDAEGSQQTIKIVKY